MAGGLGTRISEETSDKPKPMVLLDDKPILWHVMSIYASQGYEDFVIASGYLSDVIASWIKENEFPWKVTCLDTGTNTQTGGRIRRVLRQFPPQPWFVTYGDGLANVNLRELLHTHKKNKGFVTVTAVRPPARFGSLSIMNGEVKAFGEKNQSDSGWINGGFFVVEPELLSFLKSDKESFETDILPLMAYRGELYAYMHYGYWKPMDTLRERVELSSDLKKNPVPWLENLSLK